MAERYISPIQTANGRPRRDLYVDVKVRLWDRGVEGKHVLTGSIGNHPFSLLEREGNLYRPYEVRWLALKKAGLPVVPTIRKSEYGVIVTDLKADGSEIYDNHYYPGMDREHPLINPLFLDLTSPENFPLIADSVRRYQDKATEKNILTANDSPFALIVHPDSSWQIMMLDLAYVEFEMSEIENQARSLLDDYSNRGYHDPYPFEELHKRGTHYKDFSTYVSDFIAATNHDNTNKFLGNLQYARRKIKEVSTL